MDLTIGGMIASLVVVTILFGMMGLIFNETFTALESNKKYLDFFTEAQMVSSTLNQLLSQSVWTTKDKILIPNTTSGFKIGYFDPSGGMPTVQDLTLEYDSASREIRFGGKKVLGLSNMISNIKFEVNDTNILMTIETDKIKDSQGKNVKYTVPLLTILTESS
ncbi:MAG TPA: hypothetical protein DE117_02285 [Fervidobacterium sp.]|nr:hypothetical protein [Fervidobacterium sp.]